MILITVPIASINATTANNRKWRYLPFSNTKIKNLTIGRYRVISFALFQDVYEGHIGLRCLLKKQ